MKAILIIMVLSAAVFSSELKEEKANDSTISKEQTQIDLKMKIELFKSGSYASFVVCPLCGSINHRQDKTCFYCKNEINDTLMINTIMKKFEQSNEYAKIEKKISALSNFTVYNGIIGIMLSGGILCGMVINAAINTEWVKPYVLLTIPLSFNIVLNIVQIKHGKKILKELKN
jgi:hypothetical protein